MRPLAQADQQLVIGYGPSPITLDPANAVDRQSIGIIQNIFDSLVEFDAQGRIGPALAESWEQNEQGTEWTFQLRPGVLFHDGTEFNADAVKANMDRILENADLKSFQLWSPILDAVEVTDTFGVRFYMKVPTLGHLSIMAEGFGGIASPESFEFSGSVVGTGAFSFQDWVSGEYVVLAANASYWRQPPAINELVFRLTTNDDFAVFYTQALLNNEIDVAADVNALTLASQAPTMNIFQTMTPNLFYWAFNVTKDIFQDSRVRQACNFAIDRDFLVREVLHGEGQPADAPIPPPIEGYRPIGTYTFDPIRAIELLAAAGFPSDWSGVAFVSSDNYYNQDRRLAEEISRMLSEVGVRVELRMLSGVEFEDAVWGSAVDSPLAQERDFAQVAYGSTDPGYTFRVKLGSDSWPTAGRNEAFFADPDVDARIEAIDRSRGNRDHRVVLIQELCEAVYNSAVPWIFSHFEVATSAATDAISGLQLLPNGTILFRDVQRSV